MSVKHVCPNCGSTLTLDAPMPSLRCPKCKTAMQPETVANAAAAEAPVRPMRVARTVSTIGVQSEHTDTERFLKEAQLQAIQERDRLLAEANQQIQQAKQEAEAALQQLQEQKLAEATAEAASIVETAKQNAARLQQEAEATVKHQLEEVSVTAQKRLEEAEATAKQRLEEAEAAARQIAAKQESTAPKPEESAVPQDPSQPATDALSFEEKKAQIDKIARQNQFRFWKLNAYIALLILTFICAIKANGNTLVAVLSSLAAIISLGLSGIAVYTLRACIAMLKAEKKDTSVSAPSATPVVRKTPVLKVKKEKAVTTTDESQSVEKSTEQPTADDNQSETPETPSAEQEISSPTVRKTLLPVVKKKPSKPLFVKKKNNE